MYLLLDEEQGILAACGEAQDGYLEAPGITQAPDPLMIGDTPLWRYVTGEVLPSPANHPYWVYTDNGVILGSNPNNMYGNSGWVGVEEAPPGDLWSGDGIPLYKLVEGEIVSRTPEEIAADRQALAATEPPAAPVEQRMAAAETTLQAHDQEIEAILTGLEALAHG